MTSKSMLKHLQICQLEFIGELWCKENDKTYKGIEVSDGKFKICYEVIAYGKTFSQSISFPLTKKVSTVLKGVR